MRASYEKGVTDEFVIPAAITTQAAPGKAAAPRGLIRDDDAAIFFNFRADRARQITKALIEPGFDKIADPARPTNLAFVAMTQYEKTWPWLRYILAPEKLEHILANVFAELDFKNLRIAETEKYAHVTYFFNGGVEKPFPGEERVLVPSPKVPTYDLKPEMSAAGVADAAIKAIEKGDFDAIIMNFANADMVGPFGQARSDHQGLRNGGRAARQNLPGAARPTKSAGVDHHRGPRQRRDDDRSHHRRPAHLSHHESRSVSSRYGR